MELLHLNRDARRFEKKHTGRLPAKLPDALRRYTVLARRLSAVNLYVDIHDALPVDQKTAECIRRRRIEFERIGTRFAFLFDEICAISQETLDRIKTVWPEKYGPHEDFVTWTRRRACGSGRPALLPENGTELQQEKALAIADLRLCLDKLQASVQSTSHKEAAPTEVPNANVEGGVPPELVMYCREPATAVLNKVAVWSILTLPPIDAAVDRRAVEIVNDLDMETVRSIETVGKSAAALVIRRFYALKKRILSHKCGIKNFKYRDRDKPIPIESPSEGPSWKDAVQTVSQAFEAFLPPMADTFRSMLTDERIDAVPLKAHGCHVLLATKKRLQPQPSPVISEMVALFGENIIYQYLLDNAATKEARLACLLRFLDHWKTNVISPLVLHHFEGLVHQARTTGVLTGKEIDQLYLASLRLYYGDDGDVFDDFDGAEATWPQLTPHLTVPFYIFSYAAAQLLADFFHSSLASDAEKSSRSLFFSILGRNRSTVLEDLKEAFGVRAATQDFWDSICRDKAGRMLQEAEELAQELGLVDNRSMELKEHSKPSAASRA